MKTNDKFTKVVCSITDMSSVLQLSRARFYQLLNSGHLPLPIYDINTKRPYYDLELQEKCLRVKATGIGVNGQYILFYNSRQKLQEGSGKPFKKKMPKHQELIETLSVMGLEVSGEQVEQAIRQLYPQGINGLDEGLVVREIYRFFKNRGV